MAATEAAYERLARVRAAAGKDEEDPGGGPDKGKAKAADKDPPMRSDAGVRPRDVDDRKTGLEERLRQGFMAAYRHRVALATGEPVQTN